MRILVAEDEALSQRLLTRVLESMGHQVVVTSDGDEAWEAFRREPFRVVVTDWKMPKTDGLELTRRIRSSRGNQYTWVILLTAMDFHENYAQTMEQGVDDFLTKPLDHELLRVRLKVAERICAMSEQVEALSSAIPICMHCKSIRNEGDDWLRVEEYFKAKDDLDFSHSLCPDCFYDHSLQPELTRLYEALGDAPAPDPSKLLDTAVFERLARFDADDSPGLLDDMLEGLTETSTLLRHHLQAVESSGLRGKEAAAAFVGYRRRCVDLGAGRLADLLGRLAEATDTELMGCHAELCGAALAELEPTLVAVRSTAGRIPDDTGTVGG